MYKYVYRKIWCAILVIIFTYLIALPVAHAEPPTTESSNSEQELRAAVVIGILRFATQYDHDGLEYLLCLVGAPPSSEHVTQGTGLNISKDRKLTVQTLAPDALTTNCAAIVVGPTLTNEQQALIAQQAKLNSSILICDDCGDETLTHVSLRRQNHRIVFAVDIALAQQSQITFSSKLLSLAVKTQR